MILDGDGWSYSAGGGSVWWWDALRTLVLCVGAALGLYGIRRHDGRHKTELNERSFDRLATSYSSFLANVHRFTEQYVDLIKSRKKTNRLRDQKENARSEFEGVRAGQWLQDFNATHVEPFERASSERKRLVGEGKEIYERIIFAAVRIEVEDRSKSRVARLKRIVKAVELMDRAPPERVTEGLRKRLFLLIDRSRSLVSGFAAEKSTGACARVA